MIFRPAFLSAVLLAVRTLATDHKGIPSAFTRGFSDQSGLQVEFPAVGDITDGQDLTSVDTSKVPKFLLGDSSGINTNAKFIVLMIDPDVSGSAEVSNPQRLHYLRTDFSPSGDGVAISSQKAPDVKYVGPDATPDANGVPQHRYVFLLYSQPRDFVLKGVDPNQRDGFDVAKWREENGLKPAVAGLHFLSTVGGGAGVVNPPPAAEQPPNNGGATTTPCTTSTTAAVHPPPVATPPAQQLPPAEPSTILITVTASCDCSSSAAAAPIPTLTAELPAGTAPAAPAAPAKTHSVIVGGQAGLVYTPEWVEAAPGDTVLFDFLARNHTVTQSTFDLPCALKVDGVKSGFRANAESIPGKETFAYTVEDDKPRWFYCAQGNHCGMGMVFAVNPGTTEKFAQFKAKAVGNATAGATGVGAPGPIATGGLGAIFTGAASAGGVSRGALAGMVGAAGIALALF